MIEFKHKLPAMKTDGVHLNGTYNNRELGFPSVLTTTDPRLGLFLHTLRSSICAERSLVFIDGKILAVDKNWIRDHVHVMKAMRHWEYDLKSFLDFIIATQRPDGQFYELIKQMDDVHWQFVNEDCLVFYPEDNLSLVRLELEADIEYLVVEGAVYLYRTTGDDAWLEWARPKLEKGIDYITSDPKRWDEALGLVKRPFTIDTWDFTCRPDAGTMYDVISPAKTIRARILLPRGKTCSKLLINGKEAGFALERVGTSEYVRADTAARGTVSFELIFG